MDRGVLTGPAVAERRAAGYTEAVKRYRGSGRILAVGAAALALGLGGSALAAAPAPPLPVLGVDPIAQGTVLENHDCALQHWLERGFSGAVLLHVDTHDDMRPVDERRLAALRELRDRGEIAAMAPRGCGTRTALFNEGNFIRAAAGLGIVREVVWVVPFTFLHEEGATERLARYLDRAGFSSADAATFQLKDGWYRGTVGGLPVTLCDQERLPPLAEPVLLSVDVDYFPFAASYRGHTLIAEIRLFFSAIRQARYAVRDTVVAYSVQSGYLPVRLRWVGDAVAEVLRDPAIGTRAEAPARWKDLQQLELLAAREDAGLLGLNLAFGLLEKQPHDPALQMYAAETSAVHGSGETALAYAEEACTQDRGYCVGLREIGLRLLERGDVALGLRGFEIGERLLPGMSYGQMDKGLALLGAGRRIEALKALEEIRAREGPFPIGFLIGALWLEAGDRVLARQLFDEALAALEQAPHIGVPNKQVEEAVQRAAAFYREEGLFREAQALAVDPRLRWTYDGQAQ